MSLSRLALRLAAYEALNPFSSLATGPWPTIAGDNVYDSRATPISGEDGWDEWLTGIEGKPLVIVYTEDTEVSPVAGEYPADAEIVDLVVETQIAARGVIEVKAADGTVETVGHGLAAPVTSREHEALLDLLEAQICWLLDPEGYAASAALYQTIAREQHHIHSVPQREPNKETRFAARTLRMKIRVPRAQWPAQLASPAPTGLAALPPPLGKLAAALDPNSSGGRLCAQLAAMIAPASVPVPLTDVRIFANFDRGATPSAANADETADVAL